MHACLIDAAMVLCAWAGEKGLALGACFCLYYRCGMKVKSELGFAWMDRMDRMDRIWMLVVGGDAVVVWGCWCMAVCDRGRSLECSGIVVA